MSEEENKDCSNDNDKSSYERIDNALEKLDEAVSGINKVLVLIVSHLLNRK